ncbi:MAG: AraC family transcriptional regulator [Spirochaetaceae bacterium]|nr:MAG: AraC family transcriptional regulator [Spirochaetaceae bacterium]
MVSRGYVPFAVDGKPHPMQRGDLSITRPWQAHRVGDPHLPANRLHWIILDLGVRRPHERWRWPDWFILPPAVLQRLTELLQHNEQPVWRATPRIEESFQRLTALIGEESTATLEARLSLAVNELFLDLLELLEHHTIPLDRYLSSTRRTVEMTLERVSSVPAYPWTLEEMAATAGLGRSRFSYYCRLASGLTPVAFLNRCRVAAARELLSADPARSITDVSETCGFESSQYFARVFRKLTGCTAREYRMAAGDRAGEPGK